MLLNEMNKIRLFLNLEFFELKSRSLRLIVSLTKMTTFINGEAQKYVNKSRKRREKQSNNH